MTGISGGEKLEKYLADLAKRLGAAGSVKVGFLEGATYPDGTSVPTVAAAQEFGTGRGIRPRPYFRNMIAAKSPEWGPALGGLLEAGKTSAEALAITGDGIAGQLKQSIIDTNSPPLKPKTIKRKGFDKPLIDTSHMINSVASEVTK